MPIILLESFLIYAELFAVLSRACLGFMQTLPTASACIQHRENSR